MAPPKESRAFRERFADELSKNVWIIETERPHELQIVNKAKEQHITWVSSCTQANIISGVGEHNAIMIGYAYGQTQLDTSVQKFNCHKINEHVVGTSSKLEGDVNTFSVSLFKTLRDRESQVGKDVRDRVNFYHELLQAEKQNDIDLEYWLEYTVLFGVEHKIPLYDKMSVIEYYNIEIWSLIALIVIVIITAVRMVVLTIC